MWAIGRDPAGFATSASCRLMVLASLLCAGAYRALPAQSVIASLPVGPLPESPDNRLDDRLDNRLDNRLDDRLGNDAEEQAAQSQSAVQMPAEGNGSVRGIVTDEDGAMVPGAQLVLHDAAGAKRFAATAGSDGHFILDGLPPGDFTLTASAAGLATETVAVKVTSGGSVVLAPIELPPAMTTAEVDVTATKHDIAEAELKEEETQRLLGILPNFYVAYNWHATALAPGQKLQLGYRSLIDPTTFIITGIVAGVQQATNALPGYGPGAAGYASRYAANYGDALTGTMVGGVLLPIVFHQDPRYFYRGVGTIRSRALWAVGQAVIQRGDNGRWQPAYSGVIGDLAAGAISNAYYPASSRDGVGLTFENGLLAIGEDAVGNLVQEFVFKKITPRAPKYPSTTPGAEQK